MQLHAGIHPDYSQLIVLLFLQILTALTLSEWAAVVNILASLTIILRHGYALGKDSGRITPKQKKPKKDEGIFHETE